MLVGTRSRAGMAENQGCSALPALEKRRSERVMTHKPLVFKRFQPVNAYVGRLGRVRDVVGGAGGVGPELEHRPVDPEQAGAELALEGLGDRGRAVGEADPPLRPTVAVAVEQGGL